MYRILLPVDGDADRATAVAETVAALPFDHRDVECVVLNVFRTFDVTDDMGAANSADHFDDADPPETIADVCDALAERGFETRSRFEHGEPAETILSVANSEDVDLIVIAGRRRSPAGKVIFGSVTQDVLLGSDRPVTVVMD